MYLLLSHRVGKLPVNLVIMLVNYLVIMLVNYIVIAVTRTVPPLSSTNLLHSHRIIDQVPDTRRLIALAVAKQYFGCYVLPSSWYGSFSAYPLSISDSLSYKNIGIVRLYCFCLQKLDYSIHVPIVTVYSKYTL